MVQTGGTVVMTLPHSSETSISSHQHYQPTPHNFSRPNPRPTSSAAPLHAPTNGTTAVGSITVNGAQQGTNSTESAGVLVNGWASRSAPTAKNEPRIVPAGKEGLRPQVQTSTTPRASAEGSYFPAGTQQSGVTGTKVQLQQGASGSSPTVHKTSGEYLSPSSPATSPRYSSPPTLASSSRDSQNQQQAGSLRHRHTLQVPKPQGSRTSAPGTTSDAVASGRFSPTSSAPRRASISLGRRPTRSIHSDNHPEEIPPDEDAAKWAEAIKAKRASKRRKEEEAEDKVVVGTKVDHTHVNWVTAYNMLTGIRFVVSRINAKMDRELTDEDFSARHKFSFDITGNELTPSAKYDFKFKDYSPWVFRHLRTKFGLDPADYLMSLTSKYILSELGSPGKSGSFFYFSRDYKYIIKTIHHGEHKFLRKVLKEYYQHVEQNPNTLVSQFYGLHRVKTPFGRKIHFVVMNNLFPPHRDIHQTFDLKGSTIGRDFKEENLAENPRATLKDLNWLRRDMNLNFGPTKKQLFIEQVQRDVELLQRLGVMDYSLLLGIHDMSRGNRDDIRNSALKVFQPGGAESDDIHGHLLQRTPSKMEKARQARELRKIINKEVPITLDRSVANRLPEEFLDQKKIIFYADDGGFRATHENDEPGDAVYYLGIIDCLTHYGFLKKLEHFWRGLSHPKDQVSAIPPMNYGQRFFNFITGHIKSQEEAERERETRGRDSEAAPERTSQQASTDNAAQQLDEDRKSRSMGTIRSPSAERTGGASGTILPVVEEAGEASTPSRSPNVNGGVAGGEADAEQRTEVALPLEPTSPPPPPPPPPPPHRQPAQKDVSDDTNSKPDSAVSFGAPVLPKQDPDEHSIRVARVSG